MEMLVLTMLGAWSNLRNLTETARLPPPIRSGVVVVGAPLEREFFLALGVLTTAS
jgi:hypothetical protein